MKTFLLGIGLIFWGVVLAIWQRTVAHESGLLIIPALIILCGGGMQLFAFYRQWLNRHNLNQEFRNRGSSNTSKN